MKITMRRKKIRTLLALGLTGAGILLTGALQSSIALAEQAIPTSYGSPAVTEQSSLQSYDRSAVADKNYADRHGGQKFPLEDTNPEYAAIMKKYIYGDIASQLQITPAEAALVTIAVLTTNQNDKLLEHAISAALALGATPEEIQEAIYHITPYTGFAKTSSALTIMNDVFREAGIPLPLAKQGTTTDKNRFQKGLKFQVDTYGERIIQMRAATPDYQKHLQDDLSAFCFGDIYTRGVLDLKRREMLTMAAIGPLGIEAQFRSHVNGTLAAG
ncbi:carboxymuconolactone decarboxylase family protein, partial [Anaerovibrio sp.]|uniref:carboxymuconolactone decarboxylase family protein n=1 Tax=Anaerovibrio sp. TaxID=1872532 RepID=UPI003F146C49